MVQSCWSSTVVASTSSSANDFPHQELLERQQQTEERFRCGEAVGSLQLPGSFWLTDEVVNIDELWNTIKYLYCWLVGMKRIAWIIDDDKMINNSRETYQPSIIRWDKSFNGSEMFFPLVGWFSGFNQNIMGIWCIQSTATMQRWYGGLYNHLQ